VTLSYVSPLNIFVVILIPNYFGSNLYCPLLTAGTWQLICLHKQFQLSQPCLKQLAASELQ
jgi:hypothetical protein